ncbi:transketolase [Christensenella tenuis]|uniref:Transketolase n=1 Tax=Christensenella tenuis TaxID=2763033 RepID=A0ABR7EAJ6_9FIRM|nr:transketolase [Christensenella tenuis]MBC5646782.1 transketolase [Christensenella tenuis]
MTYKPYYEPICTWHENMEAEEIQDLALQLRRDAVDIANCSGTHSGHLGGELSAADIMAVLYGGILRMKQGDPEWEERDRLILSKGHNSAIQYAALVFRGILRREQLYTEMNRLDGILQEHSNPSIPGIEAPTGSLGMGLSVGCGFAWAARKKGQDYHTFVILGDGECTEGQVWESAMFAAKYKLDSLTAIVDYNGYILTGKTDEVSGLAPLEEKWKSFGWEARTVDGHDTEMLTNVLSEMRKPSFAPGKPRVCIAKTKKCYPVGFMMETPVNYHSAHVTKDSYTACMEELVK